MLSKYMVHQDQEQPLVWNVDHAPSKNNLNIWFSMFFSSCRYRFQNPNNRSGREKDKTANMVTLHNTNKPAPVTSWHGITSFLPLQGHSGTGTIPYNHDRLLPGSHGHHAGIRHHTGEIVREH